MRFSLCTAFFACLLALFTAQAQADLQVPSIIANGMVLQQGRLDSLWGWDKPGTTVTITFRGHTRAARAGADGRWQATVPAGAAGGPFALRISGTTRVDLSDVLVGEVWVAGGQSNMWWHVSSCADAPAEIAAADYPNIRIWDANTAPKQDGWGAATPQRTVPNTSWQAATPAAAGAFPGVPYFFARDLYLSRHVPVGIVHISVPGTEIEQHLSPAFLAKTLPGTPGSPEHRDWGRLFNGMVSPTAPYSCRGFLWWQGEYNASRSDQYRILFPGLINEWRQLWHDPTLPFLFVELANFGPPQVPPVEEAPWPSLRDAQREGLRLPQTFEVSAIDVKQPEEGDWAIHPAHKQVVGHRLFLAALAKVYGKQSVVWSGPVYRDHIVTGRQATLSFDHLGTGLTVKGSSLQGFALAGADRVFYAAEAQIVGATVVLTSPNVPHPVAVRYDWGNNPIGTLENKEGLPAFPFRSDSWKLLK